MGLEKSHDIATITERIKANEIQPFLYTHLVAHSFTYSFIDSPNSHSTEGNGTLLQYSCLENPVDGGAWWAAVYGVAQSRTRLKRLSSSSYGNFGTHSDFMWGSPHRRAGAGTPEHKQ